MAVFPALEPATRSYAFGQFPLTEVPSVSAGTVRFRHGITQQNYQLTLGYIALTDAEASLIRNHYQGQSGSYLSFMLPDIAWLGHTSTGNVAPIGTSWRYAATPEEEHRRGGLVNVSVTLVSEAAISVASSVGLALTVTATIAGGAATGA
jgi:hypothetical protein